MTAVVVESVSVAAVQVWDGPPGTAVTGQRVQIPPGELLPVVAYLFTGRPVQRSQVRHRDPLSPAAGLVVPSTVRTDGRFVWCDAVGYMAAAYGFLPDAAFLAHMRAEYFHPTFPGPAEMAAAEEAARASGMC